jgi:hypothetical protein
VVRKPNRTFFLVLLTLVWSGVVLVGYYYWHKPVSLLQVGALGRTTLDWILGAALTGLAGGAGRRLVQLGEGTSWERVVVQAAVGVGLLGFFWLGLGALGFYSPWMAWGALVFGWAILRREIAGWFLELGTTGQIWARTGVFGRALALGSGALMAGQALFASMPPTKWDALMYHLELPRRYLEMGAFRFVEANPYWGHPQAGEMIYTWAMALGREQTAVITGFCMMAVLLVGILGVASTAYGEEAGWLAVAALLLGSSFAGMLGWGYVDGLAALIGLAALLILLQSRASEHAILLGCLTGLAAGVKLTAGILLVPVLLVLALDNTRKGIRRWGRVMLAAAATMAVFSPWLAKNMLSTGNPLFPHVWPTIWASKERIAYYSGTGRSLGNQIAWLPIAATWLGIEGGSGYASDVGPLLILFAVPGLVARPQKRDSKMLIAFVATGWAAIIAGAHFSHYLQQVRLYYVLLPGVALAAAMGWRVTEGISTAAVRLNRVLRALTVLVLIFSLWKEATAVARLDPAGVLLATNSEEQYLDDSLGWYAPVMRALHELPENSRTLFLWEPRGLYAPSTAQADTWIDRWYLDRKLIGSPDAILRSWREQGFSHLLVYTVGAEYERRTRPELKASDWAALDELLASLEEPISFGGTYQLYRLR